jgi:hypothetical protein
MTEKDNYSFDLAKILSEAAQQNNLKIWEAHPCLAPCLPGFPGR